MEEHDISLFWLPLCDMPSTSQLALCMWHIQKARVQYRVHRISCYTKSQKVSLAYYQLFWHSKAKTYNVKMLQYHSHFKNMGLKTHEKVLLYVFVHVLFVGMCTVFRSRYTGKPNLSNACLLQHHFNNS